MREQSVTGLSLAIAPAVLKNLTGNNINDLLDPTNFDYQSLARQFARFRDLPEISGMTNVRIFSEEKFINELKRRFKSPDNLKQFCLEFAEKVFLSGRYKLTGLHQETADLIGKIVHDLKVVRDQFSSKKVEESLKSLRNIDRRLLDYIEVNSNPEAQSGPEKPASKISNTNYWALNEQHKQIALAIKSLERSIIKNSSSDLKDWLKQNSLIKTEDLKRLSKDNKLVFRKLLDLGLIHEAEVPHAGKLYAYAHGEITEKQFELFPLEMRERIGAAIKNELERKYSGKAHPIGIAQIRHDGVPTLLDRKRVFAVCKETGIRPSHLVLALKYFSKIGLLFEENGGYRLSQMGQGAGLGVAAVEAVKRSSSDHNKAKIDPGFGGFLQEAMRHSESYQVAKYTINSADGGIPCMTILDQLLLPAAKLNRKLTIDAINNINKAGENKLVVLGGMLSGPPRNDRRKVRTSVKGKEALDEQLKLARSFFQSIPDASILNVTSSNMDITAEGRAFEQAIREKSISSSGKKQTETAVRNSLDRKNNQKQYAMQQDLSVEIADWAKFIALVVQPLEFKLGRTLFDSSVIKEKLGIEMNELEIIRAISERIIKEGSLKDAIPSITSQFASYLALVRDEGILDKLEKVLFYRKEKIGPDEVVSRGGMALSIAGPKDSKLNYSIDIIPDFSFGKRPKAQPTAAYNGILRSRQNSGLPIANAHILLNAGELIGELGSTSAWVISAGTMQGTDQRTASGESLRASDLHFRQHQDDEKRNETVYGIPAQSSFVTITGGVHDGKITQAISYKITTPKILEVLENNRQRNLPSRKASIYITSDWQIGSPTMQPVMILGGLIDAIEKGVEEIVINGDIRQGMNYMRYTQEAQLVEYPLNGLDAQAAYIYELLNPVLRYIRAKKEAEPEFSIPKFRILPGNHETNSQFQKGLQGTWFVGDIAEKIRSYLEGWTNNPQLANDKVICPEQFIAHDNTPVDYPMLYLNRTEDLGFCAQITHYNGTGAKGSSFNPTVAGVAKAVHSLGVEEPHIRIESHMHVSGFMVRNGIICVRTGANASGSGFEEHLLYSNAPESNLYINLSTDEVPEFFVATREYQETRYAELIKKMHDRGVMNEYKSFEDYCLARRKFVSLKLRGNPTNLSEEKFYGPHKKREKHTALTV